MKQVKIIRQKDTLQSLQNEVNDFMEGKNVMDIIPLETHSDQYLSIIVIYEGAERNFKERLRDLYEEDALQFNDIIREMYADEMRPNP